MGYDHGDFGPVDNKHYEPGGALHRSPGVKVGATEAKKPQTRAPDYSPHSGINPFGVLFVVVLGFFILAGGCLLTIL